MWQLDFNADAARIHLALLWLAKTEGRTHAMLYSVLHKTPQSAYDSTSYFPPPSLMASNLTVARPYCTMICIFCASLPLDDDTSNATKHVKVRLTALLAHELDTGGPPETE